MLTDGLGSVLGLVDSAGTTTTSYTYDAFGGTSVSGAASENSNQYTSRENDGTGLYFYRARYYQPKVGRFISQDPIGFRAGVNFYGYVNGNPTNNTDPSGLCANAQLLPPLGCIFLLDGTLWCPPELGEWPEINWPQKPVEISKTDGSKKAQAVLCTAKCQLVCDNSSIAYIHGVGTGSNDDQACKAAKKDADNFVPKGCYKRHCKCTCT